MLKNKPFILVCAVGVSMAAVAAYAAIPGAFTPASIGSNALSAGGYLRDGIVVVAGSNAEAVAAQSDQEPAAPAPAPMQLAQISPVPQSFNPIAYGEGETGEAVNLPARPSRFQEESGALQPTSPVDGVQKTLASSIGDDQECLYDQYGRRQAVPLEKLVLIIRSAISASGSLAHVDDVRAVIQSDLNRSGDDQKVKAAALQQLIGLYPPASTAGRALQQPFDLSDLGFTEVNGYDPCANPAATGPSGFGRGPFADTFSTINPLPVVAARTLAVTEGGGG